MTETPTLTALLERPSIEIADVADPVRLKLSTLSSLTADVGREAAAKGATIADQLGKKLTAQGVHEEKAQAGSKAAEPILNAAASAVSALRQQRTADSAIDLTKPIPLEHAIAGNDALSAHALDLVLQVDRARQTMLDLRSNQGDLTAYLADAAANKDSVTLYALETLPSTLRADVLGRLLRDGNDKREPIAALRETYWYAHSPSAIGKQHALDLAGQRIEQQVRSALREIRTHLAFPVSVFEKAQRIVEPLGNDTGTAWF